MNTQHIAETMIRKLAYGTIFIFVTTALGTTLATLARPAQATEVTYCIDLRTNEIKVVPKGIPCPFPTTKL